jgi:hypothetical protein
MDNPRIDTHGNKWWHDSAGQVHRDNGPAIIWADGGRDWYQHSRQHRDDGPAVEWSDGDKEWCLNGKYLSFEEWLDEVDISDEDKVMMKLKYG